MRKTLAACWLLACLPALTTAQAPKVEARMESAVTGLLQTNCYLLYDAGSRDAALVDPGGPVDRLLGIIAAERLHLRYILLTHAHPDHLDGIPAVKVRYPGAKLGMSNEEFVDGPAQYARWEELFPSATVARIKSSPESLRLFRFDYASLGKPAVVLRDGQTITLGSLRILVISTPGHSRGGVCLRVGDRLFSGDTLFNGRIGSTDLPGSSREVLVASVKRLYALLPGATLVFPGHNAPTDIGREKAAGTGLK